MNKLGFTLIEVVVSLALTTVLILGLTSLLIGIDRNQAETRRVNLAVRLAESKIESLRNNHFNTLAISPPTIDFTNELPDELPSPKNAAVTITEPTEGIKRLDIEITYQDGNSPRTIELSTLIGNIGISQ